MINANELRIGNFVNQKFIKGKYRDTPVKIVKVCGTFISGVDRYFKEFNEGYEAIPITEEWLLNFGFEKTNILNMISFRNDVIKINYNTDGVFRYQTANYEIVVIKYVHQVQNLCFALTQIELKYVGENKD